jgi:hypothetical protein
MKGNDVPLPVVPQARSLRHKSGIGRNDSARFCEMDWTGDQLRENWTRMARSKAGLGWSSSGKGRWDSVRFGPRAPDTGLCYTLLSGVASPAER